MINTNFNDYLQEQLKNPEFKQEFDNETTKLEGEITVKPS